MKKIFLLIFFSMILLSFAPKAQATYTVGYGTGFGTISVLGNENNYFCNSAWGWPCQNLGLSLTAQRDTAPHLPYYFNFGSGYSIAYDAAYNDIGNTVSLTSSCARSDIPVSQCFDNASGNLGGAPAYFGVSCNTTSTVHTCQNIAGAERHINYWLDEPVIAAYIDYFVLYAPVTSCYFGVPLGNRLCPDLPDIKANGVDGPITVLSGASPTISWTTQNTVVPGTSTNYISSCIVTSPIPTSWSGLTGSTASPILTSNTTFTLTCTSAFGNTFIKSVTVNVNQLPDLTATAPTQNTATIGISKTFTSTISNGNSAAGSQQFIGSYDPDGASGPTLPQDVTGSATWSVSSGAANAEVNSTGFAKCKAAGTATITSTYNGKSSSGTLTCN
jgi:hypothetical protein